MNNAEKAFIDFKALQESNYPQLFQCDDVQIGFINGYNTGANERTAHIKGLIEEKISRNEQQITPRDCCGNWAAAELKDLLNQIEADDNG